MKWQQDTIVAIATPPGIGAIGVVRLSGPQAIAFVAPLFPSKDLKEQASHTLHYGTLRQPDGQVVDEVVISLFKAPKSYTGEEVVEISGHGSPYVLQQILQLCLDQGARIAGRGEFTQRAFLNSKMDLAQAEAVADLIAADSEAAHKTALNQLRGGFSGDLQQLRKKLIHFAAMLELELDFPEEDVEFVDRSELYGLIDELMFTSNSLIESFSLGNVIKNGVNVAIIGAPNAGKSTLLNALLNEERAIVSDIAGTTRDTIEEVLNIKGISFRLIDTAGIREHATDQIEEIGILKSKDTLNKADMVLLLLDINTVDEEELQHWKSLFEPYPNLPVLWILNKVDLWEGESYPEIVQDLKPQTSIVAKSKENIDQLKNQLFDVVIDGEITQENTIITNTRHFDALKKVVVALKEVKSAMDNEVSSEFLALDLRVALHELGTITGEVDVDRDILGTIFSEFCIGK